MTDEIRKRWDETADAFQEEIDLPVAVNWDGFGHLTEADLGLLGEVDGADVIELGCGGGQCSVALAERGATVTGVDFSRAQLAHARELADERGVDVEFALGDVRDLGAFSSDCYDIAFNAYVFQWVDDLEECFAEAHRLLRAGGRFVFSVPHPFYDLADPETHVVEESYFDTGRHVVSDEGADLVTFRHTVSGLYNDLRSVGFDVERLLEPGSSDPGDYEPGPWGERTPELMSKLPSTLVVVARIDHQP